MYSKVFIIHIHVFSLFSSSFPIKVITKYWAEFPILYNRSLLVIYFKYKSVCIWQPPISTSFVYWWIIFNLWIYHILFIINDGISHFCYCSFFAIAICYCAFCYFAHGIQLPWALYHGCTCFSVDVCLCFSWVYKWNCWVIWQPTPYFCLENSTERGAWWLQSRRSHSAGQDWVHTHNTQRGNKWNC